MTSSAKMSLPPVKSLLIDDFAGGLNVASAPAQVDANDSPRTINFTLDEKGGVVMRLGLARVNAAPLAGVIKYLTYSPALDLFMFQIGTGLYKTADFVTVTSVHTFTTADRCHACDYVDKLAVVHPIDGVFSYDGTTWRDTATVGGFTVTIASPGVFTLAGHGLVAGDAIKFSTSGALPTGLIAGTTYYVIAAGLTTDTFEVSTTLGGVAVDTSGTQSGAHTATYVNRPAGNVCAAWQNKLWIGGDPRAGNHAIVWWSNAGTFKFSTVTDFIGIREKDGKTVTALGIGNGIDVAGRPGLLVFKEDSFYRINSSTTGAYTTMHAGVGCVSANALASSQDGLIVFFARTGLYATDGVTPGAQIVSKKLQPYWADTQMNMAVLDGVCAGVFNDRLVFSFPWGAAATANTRTLEYHPADGWIVPHDFGASGFVTNTKNTQRLYSSSPTAAYVRDTFRGGTDEGSAITARFQTRWIVPEQGYMVSLQRARINGAGVVDLYVKADYDLGDGTLIEQAVDFDTSVGFVWDDASYVWDSDTFLWSESASAMDSDFWDLGACKAFAFVLETTASTSRSAAALGGDGAATEVGACALYSILVDYVRLGLA